MSLYGILAGDDEGVHWRETRGWFSYRLKNSGKKAVTVRVQYQPDARRDAYVFINDVKIGVLSDGQSVSTFSIPSDLQTAEVLTLKIAKGEKRITPHVYEVRILKE